MKKKVKDKGRKTAEEINALKSKELTEYWKKLRNRIRTRINYMKRQGITSSPALASLEEHNYFSIHTPPTERNKLVQDIMYYDDFLYKFKTSRKKGFDTYVNESLFGLTGSRGALMTMDECKLFYQLVDRIRELRPDLAKGTDRFRYRVVFHKVLTYVLQGLTAEEILVKLQDQYDILLKELEDKQAAQRKREQEELNIMLRFDATTPEELERYGFNEVEKLYDDSAVKEFWRNRGFK